ncbi:YIP1 family protein [Aeoliella sp. ICT_H6.2]|uniref:YIP1 family protein n=1 Tax=Aeoliella straminimaris TaxID=2954799 RepID=A0A9X2JJL1_9BACT|nr:Yip1 family protein [Aeoliella straminimaris]MCO6045119.1 YIP1 family protein [Aeoliella straminimaris]
MSDDFPQQRRTTPRDELAANNPFASPVATDQASPGCVSRTDIPEIPLTPWTSIWTKPRLTVRQVLDTDPKRYVLLITVLAGVSNGLVNSVEPLANTPDLGELMRLGAVVALIGAGVSLVALFIVGWIFTGLGRLSGGVGRSFELRTAIAYANVISVWCLPLNVCGVLVYWYVEHNPGELAMLGMLLAIGLIMVVCGIWQLVVLSATVAEAHQFAGRQGAATVLLPVLLIAAAVLLPLSILMWSP